MSLETHTTTDPEVHTDAPDSATGFTSQQAIDEARYEAGVEIADTEEREKADFDAEPLI